MRREQEMWREQELWSKGVSKRVREKEIWKMWRCGESDRCGEQEMHRVGESERCGESKRCGGERVREKCRERGRGVERDSSDTRVEIDCDHSNYN